jgi:exoribonuclease R
MNPQVHQHPSHQSDYFRMQKQDAQWKEMIVLSDGKVRGRERYCRPVNCRPVTAAENCQQRGVRIIPDALAWRKYLSLLRTMILFDESEETLEVDENVSASSSSRSEERRWYLLESVVEYMEYRSRSPVLASTARGSGGMLQDDHALRPEVATAAERATLRKLCESTWAGGNNRGLISFADLSFRLGGELGTVGDAERMDEDEWKTYQLAALPIDERSSHALLRSVRLIQRWEGENNTSHAANSIITFVVTGNDDATNPLLDMATDDDVQIMTVREFVKDWQDRGLFNRLRLEELLEDCERAYVQRNFSSAETGPVDEEDITGPVEYLSDEEVQLGLKNATLLMGQFLITSENNNEAFVTVKHNSMLPPQKYFVNGSQGHFNRAIHQDTVIIRPLPERLWGRQLGKRRLVYPAIQGIESSEDDDPTAQVLSDTDLALGLPTIPSGRVVALHNPGGGRRRYVATIVNIPEQDEQAVLLVPMDVRIPKIRVRSAQWRRHLINKRLLVEIENWDISSKYPNGRVIRPLGSVGDLETEIQCLLHEHQILLAPFSLAARSCLPEVQNPQDPDAYKIPEDEISQRRDLRKSRRIFSVDPPGCQDIDDSMHAHRLSNGDIEIGVVS